MRNVDSSFLCLTVVLLSYTYRALRSLEISGTRVSVLYEIQFARIRKSRIHVNYTHNAGCTHVGTDVIMRVTIQCKRIRENPAVPDQRCNDLIRVDHSFYVKKTDYE